MSLIEKMGLQPGEECGKPQQAEAITALLKVTVAYVGSVAGPVPMAHDEFIKMAVRFMQDDFAKMNDLMEEITPREEVQEMRRHYQIQTLKEKAHANDK